MSNNVVTLAYITAIVLFILSLGGLSNQETAKRGNLYGIVGMVLAIGATAIGAGITNYAALIGVLIPGVLIGAVMASRVEMTAMPELVAMLHSFVGLAAVLVGIGNYLQPDPNLIGAEETIHLIEIYVGVFIGAVTFTGSVVAFGKLKAIISSKPLTLPGRHLLNIGLLAGTVALGFVFMGATGTAGLPALVGMCALAGFLGIHLVAAIGGADMPVVISMLNSYSGWAAAAAGFMLSNDL
ncbi:MAG: NAD(P)(+) transhydrogenase (Re/Si-specific) subunit beta, partial [Cyanobacteria bacterium J06554_3]